MSSLLTYEYKPFVDSSDEESVGESAAARKRNLAVKNEVATKKKKLIDILSDSDDGTNGKLTIDDDDDDVDSAEIIAKRELEARKNAQLLLQSISKKGDNPIDIDDAVSKVDTKDVALEEKLRKIKETMEKTKRQLNTRVNTNARNPTTSQVVFLESHPLLPKIKTASERLNERKCMEPITIDMLDEYVPSIPHSELVIQPEISDVETDTDTVVKVKTRLNDSSGHIWKWKLLSSKTMGDLRLKLAELYGVSIDCLKLSFDGDAVTDSMTPESLGLTDDDMVEVKIPKELHVSAVNCAKEGKVNAAAPTQNISNRSNITQIESTPALVRAVISLHLLLDKAILNETSDEEIILKLNVYSDFTVEIVHSKIRTYFVENVPIGYYSWEDPGTPIDMSTIIGDLPPTSDESYITVRAIQVAVQQTKKGKKPAAIRGRR